MIQKEKIRLLITPETPFYRIPVAGRVGRVGRGRRQGRLQNDVAAAIDKQ